MAKTEEKKAPEKPIITDKERAMMIIKSQIAHWRKLEEILGTKKEVVAKKIGALKMVLGYIEAH